MTWLIVFNSAALLVLMWWVRARLRFIEGRIKTVDEGGSIQHDRLNTHAVKLGLLTGAKVLDIHQEMPMDPNLWDREARAAELAELSKKSE